jgi:hypothetical protein
MKNTQKNKKIKKTFKKRNPFKIKKRNSFKKRNPFKKRITKRNSFKKRIKKYLFKGGDPDDSSSSSSSSTDDAANNGDSSSTDAANNGSPGSYSTNIRDYPHIVDNERECENADPRTMPYGSFRPVQAEVAPCLKQSWWRKTPEEIQECLGRVHARYVEDQDELNGYCNPWSCCNDEKCDRELCPVWRSIITKNYEPVEDLKDEMKKLYEQLIKLTANMSTAELKAEFAAALLLLKTQKKQIKEVEEEFPEPEIKVDETNESSDSSDSNSDSDSKSKEEKPESKEEKPESKEEKPESKEEKPEAKGGNSESKGRKYKKRY